MRSTQWQFLEYLCSKVRRAKHDRRGRPSRRPLLSLPEWLEPRDMLAAQLQVAQTGVVQTSAVEGQLLDYTYQVTNVGNVAATSVTFTDTLPTSGIDFIAQSTSAGTISQASGVVTAQLGTLAVNATATVDVEMTPTAAGTLVNKVSVTSSNATTQNTSSTTTASAPGNGADLQVSGATPGQAVPGEDLKYTFTVVNNSTNAAPNALLTTQLPAGVVFLSAAASGQGGDNITNNNGVVTAPLGSLSQGQSATVTVDVMPTVAGSLTATAFATDLNGDTNLANNQQTGNTTVNSGGSANLSVSTSSPAALLVGQAGTYTITVTNNGATNASNVTLWDQIPTGAVFLDATTGQGTVQLHDNGDRFISANLGNLAQGQSATITLVLSPTTNTTIVNQAEATTDFGLNSVPSAISSKSVTATAGGNADNLSVSITPSASSAVLGQALTYTITVSNLGSTTAPNVVLTEPLPGYLLFASGKSNSGTTSSGAALGTVSRVNGSVLDTIGNLAAGNSVTLSLVVTPTVARELIVTAIATSGNGVTNTATSISQNVSTNGNVAPTSAADLVVTKTDSAGGAAVNVGQQVTYTITAKNQSAANSASNVVLADVLPSGVSYDTSSGALGTVSQVNGVVIDNIGSLAAGQTETLQITATVNSTGAISNTAVATTDSGVVNPATISSTDTLGTGSGGGGSGSADLSLALTHSTANGAIVPGQALTYTVTVTNNSTGNNASGVQISDTLPANVTYVSASSPSGSVSESNGVVSDNVGSLAPGQTSTLTVVVMAMQSGSITDSASVTSTSSDPDLSNNTASHTITVSPVQPSSTSLSITKTASPNTVRTGSVVTYTITVTNTGSNPATNVVATDLLPSGENFSSGTSSVGTVTEGDGAITANLGTLAPGDQATVSLRVSPTQTGTIENFAVVTTDSGVSNPNNSLAHATIAVTSGGGGGGGGEANLAVTNTVSPNNAFVGQDLTYTITVTNTGNGEADSVVLSNPLPAGVSLVSDSTTRGSLTVSGGMVSVNIGLMTPQQSATLTITVATTAEGPLSDTASISTPSANASSSTTATATTTVFGANSGVPGYLAGQPGDGTNATFITNLFHELLDREPDPSGAAYWTSFLAAPGANAVLQQHLMVQALLASPEYETHLVSAIYENFLHRLADSGGLAYFTAQLSAGFSEQVVISQIVTAPEYLVVHGGTPKGFVDAVYHDILGRAPEAAGETFWVNKLTSGEIVPNVVLQSFLASPEADNLLLNNTTGSALANLTLGGFNHLYFQGSLSAAAQNQFFNELASQAPYQDVIRDMLEIGQYYDARLKFLP